ncbi:response regulator transcription factor [Croceitalea marina]|uniref:Response regulator transcription factor n=1 Tax=Croceitalea marina TaxID=1775166 RepID=A0ABW5MXC0_9FLAO
MKKESYNLRKKVSCKMHLDSGASHIILYGLATASLIFGLKWLQWNFIIRENAIDIYIGLIALMFTLLGAWIASQLIKPKAQAILVDKQNMIPQAKEFKLNEAGLKRLNLTNREYQILKLIAQGHSNSEIADELFLSLSTIKTHVSNLYTKMNVKSRFRAIAVAKEIKIVE